MQIACVGFISLQMAIHVDKFVHMDYLRFYKNRVYYLVMRMNIWE
jgi:hypothetical protein